MTATAPGAPAGIAGQPGPATVVDIAFAITEARLPAACAFFLREALAARLPWLMDEPLAAIHPLKLQATSGGYAVLARRTRLVLRLPAARSEATLALSGAVLERDAGRIGLGSGAVRPLVPAATLSALRVASSAADAAHFEAEVGTMLAAQGVAGQVLAGRPRADDAGGRSIRGYALAVHGLGAADSLRLQARGLGSDGTLGWGVLVPAKTITVASA